jgi:hypothetical protein
MASARGLTVFENVADDLLGGGGTTVREREAAAHRELIREVVSRVHQRNARRRPLVSRRS